MANIELLAEITASGMYIFDYFTSPTQTVCLRIVYAGMMIRESWVLIEVSCISSLILPMIDTFDG